MTAALGQRIALSALLAFSVAGRAETLTVSVTGIVPKRGQVGYLLFDQKKGFPREREQALAGRYVDAPDAATLTFEFPDLKAGAYVVTVYQDLNGNQRLDKNFLGIPSEPVGASMNPKAKWGPPSFEDCLFTLGESAHHIEIQLLN